MKLAEILKEIGLKAGLAEDDKGLADALSIEADVSDEFASSVQNFLSTVLTEESARQNHTLRKYFHSQALNAVDATLQELLAELGLDEPTQAEIMQAPGTYKRVQAALRKMKADSDKSESAFAGLRQQFEQLNTEFENEKHSAAARLQATQGEAEERILAHLVQNHLKGLSYANADVPPKVNALTASTLLRNELAAKGIKTIRTQDDELKIVDAETGNDYTEQNKPVSFGDFVLRMLTNSKMLKVSDPQWRVGNSQHQKTQGGKGPDMSKVTSALDEQLKQFRALDA